MCRWSTKRIPTNKGYHKPLMRRLSRAAFFMSSCFTYGGMLCYPHSMKILLERHQAEIEIKKSRFIAIAAPVETVQELKTLITQTRNEHPQATHVVHAAVMGSEGTNFSMSDDHEPKNTAGRPALEVLKGSGVTNIAVLVIRYFGGTLLGTGGLVKAYGDSVKAVLEGIQTEELVQRATCTVTTDYSSYEQMKKLLLSHEGTSITESFGTEVLLGALVPTHLVQSLCDAVTELTNGRDSVVVVS